MLLTLRSTQPAGGFSPLDLSPVAYYKFNTGVTSAGGFASVWADQSGNGNDLLQPTGTNQPAYSAGILTGDGTDNYMKTAAFTLNQPTHLFIVCRQNAFTVNDSFTDGNSQYTGQLYQAGISPNLAIWAGAGVNSNPDPAINSWATMECLFNGASSSIVTDGSAAVTGNAGAANMGGLTLFASAIPATFISGSVKEIVVFDAAVTGDDLTNLRTYLNAVRDA